MDFTEQMKCHTNIVKAMFQLILFNKPEALLGKRKGNRGCMCGRLQWWHLETRTLLHCLYDSMSQTSNCGGLKKASERYLNAKKLPDAGNQPGGKQRMAA